MPRWPSPARWRGSGWLCRRIDSIVSRDALRLITHGGRRSIPSPDRATPLEVSSAACHSQRLVERFEEAIRRVQGTVRRGVSASAGKHAQEGHCASLRPRWPTGGDGRRNLKRRSRLPRKPVDGARKAVEAAKAHLAQAQDRLKDEERAAEQAEREAERARREVEKAEARLKAAEKAVRAVQRGGPSKR
jgi:hypothetical protein